MATITTTIKEGLVGAEGEEQQYSAQTRAEFMQHAVYDEEAEVWYMGREEFVNAIAPPNEDYVSPIAFESCPLHCT